MGEVHRVDDEELSYTLGLHLVLESGLILPVMHQLKCNFTNVVHHERPLGVRDSRVQAGEVP